MFSVPTDFDRLNVERFKQATEEKVRDVRCPEHHQAPRVRFQGNSLRDITISLSGCCPKVMEIANARIGCAAQERAMSERAAQERVVPERAAQERAAPERVEPVHTTQ